MKSSFLKSVTHVHWLYLVLHAALFAVGIFMVQSEAATVFAVGTSFLATGVTGWVIFVYIFLSDSLRRRIELAQSLRINGYFPSRGSSIRSEYECRLRDVKKNIDIMGFGQRALLEDFGSEFAQWKAKAKVRILLLDPEYPGVQNSVADLRDLDEGNSVGLIATEVWKFISQTRTLQDEYFHIRLYRCLPAVNIFRVDDELFWGPYFIGRVSRNSPTFIVGRSGALFDDLMVHFDRIWQDDELSREVPSENGVHRND